jgi:uncharacterized protein
MRRLAQVLAAMMFFGAALLLAACWWLSGVLTQPRPSSVLVPTELALQSLSFKSSDNIDISASYLPPQNASTTCILFLHGNGGSRLQFVSQLRMLKEAGFGALAIDFRGHGQSKGKLTTAGGYEARDADAAFDVLLHRCGPRKIIVYGFSLGGAAALQGKVAANADGLVLDAVYQNIEMAISVRLEHLLGRTSGKLLTPVILKMLEIRTGLVTSNMDNVRHAKSVTAPMLMLIGGADWQAPESQMRAIAKASQSKSIKTIVVPGSPHGANAHYLGNRYKPVLLTFIDNVIKQ